MKHSPTNGAKKRKVRREKFADGSALITCPNGSVLILESNLSREATLREIRPVNYSEPPPPPRMKRR